MNHPVVGLAIWTDGVPDYKCPHSNMVLGTPISLLITRMMFLRPLHLAFVVLLLQIVGAEHVHVERHAHAKLLARAEAAGTPCTTDCSASSTPPAAPSSSAGTTEASSTPSQKPQSSPRPTPSTSSTPPAHSSSPPPPPPPASSSTPQNTSTPPAKPTSTPPQPNNAQSSQQPNTTPSTPPPVAPTNPPAAAGSSPPSLPDPGAGGVGSNSAPASVSPPATSVNGSAPALISGSTHARESMTGVHPPTTTTGTTSGAGSNRLQIPFVAAVFALTLSLLG